MQPRSELGDARAVLAAAIRAHAEADPFQRTEREDLHSRATVWVDELTGDPEEFALSVARGLSTRPRQLDCRYLYDEIGSELFARITEQPEYYPTRAEAETTPIGWRASSAGPRSASSAPAPRRRRACCSTL